MNVIVKSPSSYFTTEQLEKLEGIMHERHTVAGTYLFWEGDELGKLYYVKSGAVKIIKSTEDGKNLILSILNEGDLVGEMSGNGSEYFGYSAEVVEDAKIGVIDQSDLEKLLIEHGDFSVSFIKWMSTTNMKLQTKFRDLLLYGKTGALASTLIRMSNTYGVECDDGIQMKIRVNNTELADMIGATRESVNRMLSSFREDGTISMREGRIVIHDIDELRTICACPSFPRCPPEICRL